MRQLLVLLAAGVLLEAPDSRKTIFLIKYFLNSNSTGANCNLATMVACAVYSAYCPCMWLFLLQ
jgi:hypothetical protein